MVKYSRGKGQCTLHHNQVRNGGSKHVIHIDNRTEYPGGLDRSGKIHENKVVIPACRNRISRLPCLFSGGAYNGIGLFLHLVPLLFDQLPVIGTVGNSLFVTLPHTYETVLGRVTVNDSHVQSLLEMEVTGKHYGQGRFPDPSFLVANRNEQSFFTHKSFFLIVIE